MTAAYLLAVVALIGVAWIGIAAPVIRRRPVAPTEDPPPDRLRARELVRSLRALERERAEGEVAPEEYEALRDAAEERAATALARLAPSDASESPPPPPPARRRYGAALLVVALVAGTAIPLLRASVRPRPAGGVLSGDLGPGASANGADPLASFEDRVRRNPNDIAGRLDLAHRYLDRGQGQAAVEQYLALLSTRPDNAEALAHLGLILFQAGRVDEALTAQDRALSSDPRYPEALLYKGLILLRGKSDRAGAIRALEAYLRAAPYGSGRRSATQLLEEARTGRR